MIAPPPARPAAALVEQLRELGVEPSGVLVVHTAFSKVAPVEGGPEGLIAALREVLGLEGTLVMPSMSDDDDHPFDPATTPARGMGIVSETFRQQPGMLRSNSPHAFAAAGPEAEAILAPHPIDFPHGLDSPVGRAYERDAQVLLLGVGHSENTTIHLAEAIAGVRYRQAKELTILHDGREEKLAYREIDHCCERFTQLDEWLDEKSLQRRGTVGHAEARLARSRDIVALATSRLADDETVFLHASGVDAECDEARASLEGLPRWQDAH
jgi:aminoglycoside 3-N-acetyltransferase